MGRACYRERAKCEWPGILTFCPPRALEFVIMTAKWVWFLDSATACLRAWRARWAFQSWTMSLLARRILTFANGGVLSGTADPAALGWHPESMYAILDRNWGFGGTRRRSFGGYKTGSVLNVVVSRGLDISGKCLCRITDDTAAAIVVAGGLAEPAFAGGQC